ncbi:MAG: hypothetical protein NTY66_04465 [Candidatus Vogelbacteria bacterium]|nr:hypothetical protein [Candidatus Vogelbacteria bacterium]
MKDFFNSKTFRYIVYGFLLVAVLLAIFSVGVRIGFRKAEFSYRFSANYERNFGGRPGGGMMNLFRDEFTGGHGTVGKIIKIALPQIVVSGPGEVEKIVIVGDDTQVRRFRDLIKPTDLKEGETAVVIGVPNADGLIEAKLIRVLPPLPGNASTTNKK